MNPFRYVKATSPADALARMGGNLGARFVAGGTTLLDLMKLGVETPGVLIDINHLGLDGITEDRHGLHIGAHVSNTGLAEHDSVKKKWPVVSQAILVVGEVDHSCWLLHRQGAGDSGQIIQSMR